MSNLEQKAVFAIACTLIMSFIYFIILDRIKGQKEGWAQKNKILIYLIRKIGGFVLLGGIPFLVGWLVFSMHPLDFGLKLGESLALWPWILGASIFLLTLNFFNSGNPGIRAMYPELRRTTWNISTVAIAAGGWILYLTAYEYLFRGLLLFSCIEACGIWLAVTINLALYAALHLPKGIKEAAATLPFGALICYLTIESGSIIPAVFLHALQAISCELFCIYRNPEMSFHLSKRNLS